MSPALLSERLKDLETVGMVTRSRIPDDAGLFGYGLTQAEQDLKPVIEYLSPLGIKVYRAGYSRMPADLTFITDTTLRRSGR